MGFKRGLIVPEFRGWDVESLLYLLSVTLMTTSQLRPAILGCAPPIQRHALGLAVLPGETTSASRNAGLSLAARRHQ